MPNLNLNIFLTISIALVLQIVGFFWFSNQPARPSRPNDGVTNQKGTSKK